MKKALFLLLTSLIVPFTSGCDVSFISVTDKTEKGDDNTSKKEINPGTLENPLTVKEAIDLIGTNTSFSEEKIYVKGIVSGNPRFNSNGEFESFTVSLSGEGTSKKLMVYYGIVTSSCEEKFLKEKDEVIACGHYTYYASSSQPELAGNDTIGYPNYLSIKRNIKYESLEENERETVETTITFDEASAATQRRFENGNCIWENGIFSLQTDDGSQYSTDWNRLDPFRFYVGTYLHFRVSSGTFKYMKFVTAQYYQVKGDEPVTNGKSVIESSTLAYIVAEENTNYIKMHNSKYGQTKDVYVKQIRIYSITCVSYK